MIDAAQLLALSTVLRCGSFDAAAAALNLTPSAISQRIRALEDRMGTILILRSQPCRATPAGLRLARHAEDIQLLEQALASDLGTGPTTRPSLRVAVNADSLATWFLPALVTVPEVLFDLVIDDQDHSADLLRRAEVMAAVTSSPDPVQGCDSHGLGALRYVATASPAFRDRWFGAGLTPAAFSTAPALVFNMKDRLQADWARDIAGRRVTLPAHVIGSSEAFVTAARAGLGWGMNPEPLVRAALAEGSLVALAPEIPLDVPLYWQASRLSGAGLRPLTQAIRGAAKRDLRPLIDVSSARRSPGPANPRPGNAHRRS